MAVTVDVEGPDVVVRMSGWDAVWGLAGTVRVPLAQIETADVEPRANVSLRGVLRLAGTSLPGVIQAGRFGWFGRSEYWHVRRGQWVLVLRCVEGARFDRLVIEVDGDPHAALAAIRTPQPA
jgi:hypothetical protein